jgi:hypothetical protein
MTLQGIGYLLLCLGMPLEYWNPLIQVRAACTISPRSMV